jgi:hypothetical protein
MDIAHSSAAVSGSHPKDNTFTSSIVSSKFEAKYPLCLGQSHIMV